MKTKMSSKVLLSVAALFFFIAGSASALDYPTKPVNLVVAFTPGASMDVVVRLVTDKISENLGVPVTVLNKPGSGGMIGGDFVAKSKPDGYNILVFSLAHILRQAIDPKMPFDVLKDFEPICLYVTGSLFFCVKADSKFKTIEELVDFAKKNPGKLTFGHSGIGATGHFGGEYFKSGAKVNFKHVPFGGDAQAFTAVMGGHVDACVISFATAIGGLRSGEMRALACYDEKRRPELPDVPTLKERGYDVAMPYWFGFVAPAGTPKEIVAKLDSAIRAAIKHPTTQAGIKQLGYQYDDKGAPEYKQFMKSQYETFDRIAKEGGITVQ